MSKKDLSERDICTKFVTPALQAAGWDILTQIREEVTIAPGRIIVRGKMVTRGKAKRADYILYHKPNIPLGVIEAKDNHHGIGAGMQRALEYADLLDVPFVFSTNGDGFLFHDRTQINDALETELALDEFPAPAALWLKYRAWKGLKPEEEKVILQDYFDDGSGKAPRYYQQVAINKTVDVIARGQQRILLVMATGTGKTYTAFQIIWRLWKARRNQDIKALTPYNSELGNYLIILFKGIKYQVLDLVERSTHGTCRLPFDRLANLLLPIPPLPEQRRIIAKVDQLMSLCNQLEISLQTNQQTTNRLLDALIAEALSDSPDPETVEAETQLALSD